MNSNPKAYANKILIFREDIHWDIGTKEKAEAAFKKLFKILDEAWDCYSSFRESREDNVTELKELKENLEQGKVPSLLVDEAKRKIANLDHYEHHQKRHEREVKLYNKAKAGDVDAIYKLLDERRHLEYEEWHIEKVKNPLEDD